MSRYLLILLLALLSACASVPKQPGPMYRPLPAEARTALHGADVLIGVQPMEIDTGSADRAARNDYGNNYGGGIRVGNGDARGDLVVALTIMLIAGAFILVERGSEAGNEAWQRYMAGRAAAPLARSVDDLDFGAQLRAALLRDGGPALIAHGGEVSIVTPPSAENFDAHYAMSGQDAVLVVQLGYAMSHDLNTLTLKADARLIPRADAMWQMQYRLFRAGQRMDVLPGKDSIDPRRALYRRVMQITQSLPAKTDDRDKAATAWAANQGAPLRSALVESLNVVARVLSNDLDGKPALGVIEADGKRFVISTDNNDITHVYAPH